jgi:hypothetical protein
MGEVLPHDSAAWTTDEELSGRRAFDCWRFKETDKLIHWDWADLDTIEKRHWIERANRAGLPSCRLDFGSIRHH